MAWSTIIYSDDVERGGKLVAFVLEMVDDSELQYSSIELYVWGLRTWQKLQFQADPVYGIMGWDDFMAAVKVLTWVPHEPHRAASLEVVGKIIADADQSDFEDVQFVAFMLTLLYSFSRSECPCPKTYTGR